MAIDHKPFIIAVDPGSCKVGYAVVYDDLTHGEMGIIPYSQLGELFNKIFKVSCETWVPVVAIGNGTKSTTISEMFLTAFPKGKLVSVDERNTTLEARKKYFEENPPKGLWKLVPMGLQSPSRPIDDYAAWLIGIRYFLSVK